MTDNLHLVAACTCVGALWGCTNSFIKRGSVIAEATSHSTQQRSRFAAVNFWHRLLTTWGFVLPQALNLIGSASFAFLLGKAPLSCVVPIANATSLLSNAVTDWAIGEQIDLAFAAPGVLFLAFGVYLCAT